MKKKLLLTALLMLISLPIFSQTDTVKLPFEIAKKIALDLEEKDRLQSVYKVNTLIIANLKEQNSTLSLQSENKSTQLALLRDSYNILKTQLEAEKAKKPGSNWLVWALGIIAAFGSGIIVGLVN